MAIHPCIEALRSLLQETKEIFASPEDALYFHSLPSPTPQKPPTPSFIKPVEKAPEIVQAKPKAPEIIKPLLQPALPKKETPKPEVPKAAIYVQTPPPMPSASSLSSHSHFFALFQKLYPQIPLVQEIPSDAHAKKIASRWKMRNQIAPITILSFQEPQKQKELLIGISKAIDLYFGPARLVDAEKIEKEKQWDMVLTDPHLKYVIICDYTLWQLANLMPFYKENSAEQMRTLGNVPLLLLPDLSLYLKDPLLKRSLWKGLCKKLSS